MSDRAGARLHAYLGYDDPDAALEWLTAVGFEVTTRQDGPDGSVVHAEVRMGEIVLMIASADRDHTIAPLRGTSSGSGLYVFLPEAPDVDDWYRRAVDAGARDVIAPENTPWGSRRARVLDPEGHEWSVGDYRPGRTW
ncbi:VOC family protein [Streptomyces cellostaticus]|uniref:VOC family protein n=1 Tax=Streptomyces cellostaticus TaxID=67285 RepID=UPI002025DE38|nr:VOC family protein [Streptomyces cellostaticus]